MAPECCDATPPFGAIVSSGAGSKLVKGVIFNILEEVVSTEMGYETWDALLDAAGLEGAYTSLGSYPDAEILALVAAAAAALGKREGEVLRWFGQRALPLLVDRYPVFFDKHDSARDFILNLNTVIHAEVRKLYAGTKCPRFTFRVDAENALIIGYHSDRLLCDLAQGFIEGTTARYGEAVEITHPTCEHRGDAACEFRVAWL